jgi:hypothetical protein
MNQTRVYSVNAKDDLDKEVKEAKRLLKSIGAVVDIYENLGRCHYGNVGDMGYVRNKLGEINSFLGRDHV